MGCIFWVLDFDFIVIHHSFVLSLQQEVGVMEHDVTKEGTLPLVSGIKQHHQLERRSFVVLAIEGYKIQMIQARNDAQEAMHHGQELLYKETSYQPYHKREKVKPEGTIPGT
jgi:hypothetical protein